MIGSSVQGVAQTAINDALSLIDLVRNAGKYEAAIGAYASAMEQAAARVAAAEDIERRLHGLRRDAELAQASAAEAQARTQSYHDDLTARERLFVERVRELDAREAELEEHKKQVQLGGDRVLEMKAALDAQAAKLESSKAEFEERVAAKDAEIAERIAVVDAKQLDLDARLDALRAAATSLAG